MSKKQKTTAQSQVLELLKNVLPKAVADQRLVEKIYSACEKEFTAKARIEHFEKFCAKAELPAGVSSGRHTHPGEEVGYVLEGAVTVERDGQSKTFKAGETFAIPAGQVHNAVNAGTTQATIVSTYIVEKGKPLATPVK